MNKIGYKGILDELTKDLPRKSIHLSSKVTVVDYSGKANCFIAINSLFLGEKTKLKINDDKFYETQYDYVIVTVPLGYLKAHANEMFEPKLPQQKSDVIEALGKLVNLLKTTIHSIFRLWRFAQSVPSLRQAILDRRHERYFVCSSAS